MYQLDDLHLYSDSAPSLLCVSLCSLSLIEPGPVHTEFEAKMIQDVKQKEFPGADPDTVHYFKNVYLPSSVDIFEVLGQTPDDIARVSSVTNRPCVLSHMADSRCVVFMTILPLSAVHQESDRSQQPTFPQSNQPPVHANRSPEIR